MARRFVWVAALVVWTGSTLAAPPADSAVPAVLEPLQAKVGRHWAFKGTVLSFRAEQALSEEQWKAIEGLGVKQVYTGGKGLDDAAVARLVKMGLTGFSVDGSSMTEAGLVAFKQAPGLAELGIGHHMSFKGPGFEVLANHPTLTSLSVGGTAVGDPAMPFIATIKGLKRLHLNHDRVTDGGLAAIANHPALESFMISPNWMPSITDETVKTLATIKTLREIEIDQTVLTYEGGLKFLKELPKLEKVTLREVGVSEADLAKLKADLPKVDLKWTAPTKADSVEKWTAQLEKMRAGKK